MALEISQDPKSGLMSIRVTGKLAKDDYDRFLPEVEKMIAEHGKISILFEMHDFHGWSASALWEDFKFDLKHFSDIRRLALVGESKWEKGMAAFCRPFTTAKIRYFNHGELEEARAWVAERDA